MFTLIKREIEDNVAYFIGAAILSSLIIFIILSWTHDIDLATLSPAPLVACAALLIPGIFVFCGMGVHQMYADKNKNISRFMSMLPVSRGQILTARVIAGIAAIAVLILPLVITAGIMLDRLSISMQFQIYQGFVFEIFSVTFLMTLACYCIGLQNGWTSGKVAPTIGSLGLTAIFLPLIFIKGFGLLCAVILLLFIIASITRTWQNFKSTSL